MVQLCKQSNLVIIDYFAPVKQFTPAAPLHVMNHVDTWLGDETIVLIRDKNKVEIRLDAQLSTLRAWSHQRVKAFQIFSVFDINRPSELGTQSGIAQPRRKLEVKIALTLCCSFSHSDLSWHKPWLANPTLDASVSVPRSEILTTAEDHSPDYWISYAGKSRQPS